MRKHVKLMLDRIKRDASFFSKILRTKGCWLWTGRRTGLKLNPYGSLKRNGKQIKAHRYAYQLSRAKVISKGLDVCHTCDTPLCVRPTHLFLGTRKDNMQDAKRKGRINAPQGSANGKSILTENLVRLIKTELRATGKIRQTARRFNLHHCTVYSIASGRTWKSVTI